MTRVILMPYSNQEQREYPRYSYTEGPAVPFVTIYPGNSASPIRSHVRDVSQGGVGLRGEYSIKENEVVRCALSLPGVPVPIPILMRVQWSRKVNHGYLIGLQFLV